MPLKHLQHVQDPSIYFCNIKMKQLQYTSETSETLETCICNIRILLVVVSSADRGKQCPASDDLFPGGTGVVMAVHAMAMRRWSGGHEGQVDVWPCGDEWSSA